MLLKKKKTLQPQPFGSSSEQTALETQLEENDKTRESKICWGTISPKAVFKLEK